MDTIEEPIRFGTEDFAVFFVMLGLAIIIGIYYAWKDRKKETIDTYYFGGRNMSPLPVGLSISVTYISAITIITYPIETYLFGTVTAWYCIAMIIPNIIQCLFYIPLSYRLQLKSLYEYLERRYNHLVRKLASLIMCTVWLFFMATTVYVPALALSAVTPLSILVTIALTGATCTFYTALGGMKAVVWIDSVQTFIMLAGGLAVLIQAALLVGGFGNMWSALERGGRLNLLTFNPDPTMRTTFWTVVVGTAITWSTPSQPIIQRYLTCGSVKRARQAALIATFPSMIFIGISIMNGSLMYAYYENCDPLESNKIEKPDQMLPYMVQEIFRDLPGIAGLFVAAAFSGTLSTVSSGINALAFLVIEDFIIVWKPTLSSNVKVSISKTIVFVFGIFVTVIAMGIMNIDSTIFQIAYTFFGTMGGPLLGVFAMAMFLPWTNTKGAIFGQVAGTAITGWIAFGSFFNGKSANSHLSQSTHGCYPYKNTSEINVSTTTFMINPTTSFDQESNGLETTLYAVSFLYYGIISLVVTVFFGLIGSFVTGFNKPSETDPMLFFPIISNPIFPKKLREFFRFGVPPLEKNGSKLTDENDSTKYNFYENEKNELSSRYDEQKESFL